MFKKPHAIDRFFAKGIDLIILVVITFFLKLIWYPFALIFAPIYALTLDAISGQSFGKKLIGLKVINRTTETKITYKESVLRNLSFGLLALFAVIPFMGWILMLLLAVPLLIFEAYLVFNIETGYRLGDILANTQVVYSKEIDSE
jgi:uncharacterized RDD family membrane protein YckC